MRRARSPADPGRSSRWARGDYEAADATAVEAAEIGERFGDRDLMWLARDDQGSALIKQGRVALGLRLVDELLVAATAGELSPIVTGIVYCNTIAFCRDAYALRHACEWTEALTAMVRMAARDGRPHGTVPGPSGRDHAASRCVEDALEEARRAAERFTQGVLNQLARGKALYRQAEVHRLRGDFGAAEDFYRRASRCGCEPQPGLALLRLAEGEQDAAAGAIRARWARRRSRSSAPALLPAYVDIMLAAGEHRKGAQPAAASLSRWRRARQAMPCARWPPPRAERSRWPRATPWALVEPAPRLRAVAGTRSALRSRPRARADRGPPAGNWAMRTARRLELEAARAVFTGLGAAPELARLDRVRRMTHSRRRYARTDRARARGPQGLSRPGTATGRSPQHLVISEHTVARHLQNIFAKLGVSSRTAASAFAFEHDLIHVRVVSSDHVAIRLQVGRSRRCDSATAPPTVAPVSNPTTKEEGHHVRDRPAQVQASADRRSRAA